MTKYKINRNKPGLSDEQINKHKDFQNVLNDHQKILKYKHATKPLYKNPKFLGLIVLLSVVLLVFVITENENKKEKQPAKDSSAVKETTPSNVEEKDGTIVPNDTVTSIQDIKPIEKKSGTTSENLPDVPFQKFTIDPIKGAVLYTGTNRILIPPSAFTDRNGNIVDKEVEIRFRELNDPVKIFLAGIPMHYDTAQKNQQLISAGMFEIRGYTNNKPVSIKQPVTVEMASPDHRSYNSYYFNESKKEWEFVAKEKKSMRFVFAANDKDFPEMVPFKDLIWEFAINDQQKNPDEFKHIFSKTWNKFFLDEKLKPATPKNVTLKKNTSEPKFLALPVALTSNKELNEEIIQTKYKQYYEALKKKDKDEKAIEEAKQKQAAWLQSPEGKEYLKWSNSADGQKQILSSRIITVFSINQFGIWNCDTPEKLPEGAEIIPSYTDQDGKHLNIETAMLVDYNKNSVYQYYKNKPLKFNPKSDNVLWSSLPNGKIAVYKKEQFKSLATKGKVTLMMEIFDINGNTENDVKKILGMQNHITSKQEEKDQISVSTYARKVEMKKEVREGDQFFRNESGSINSNGRVK